jgi:hypothetical protein
MNNVSNSDGVNGSNGVNNSYGVNNSKGVNYSEGVNDSYGVNNSFGALNSFGVDYSKGVNYSDGVNYSEGVNDSKGVNDSDGVNNSNGVNNSYGVLNSYGVDKAIFLANKKRTYTIFGTEVSKERFNQVWHDLKDKLGSWYPKFNNAYDLYIASGKNWSKIDASDICSKLEKWNEPYEAWKDMPQDAIDYVVSLPEFDAKIFKEITGIDVNEIDDKTEEAMKLLKKKGYKIIRR